MLRERCLTSVVAGNTFHSRCNACMEICKTEVPVLKETSPGYFSACHLY